MFRVNYGLIFLTVLALTSKCEGRKLQEENQDDDDDSMDCNDGRKMADPILAPFMQKLRGLEMIPAAMNKWIIYFDANEKDLDNIFGTEWNYGYLTESGLSKENQTGPYGRILYSNETSIYIPKVAPLLNDMMKFRIMYSEELLMEVLESVKIIIRYDPTNKMKISKSAARLLQVLTKHSNPKRIYVLSSSCANECSEVSDDPLISLATCGSINGKRVLVNCMSPEKFDLDSAEWSNFGKNMEAEFQNDLPVEVKQDLQKVLSWLLKRISQRMRNYMEMAFTKNRFKKTPMDLYNKVNLQISKIKGAQTFEASKSSELIYNSLFDLNVFLNVTNTPHTFDKFHSFNLYLNYIAQFSKWRLDTTKYANFFEPLKDLSMEYVGSGKMLMQPATKIFEFEEGVYDLNGAICHENVLYIVNGMTNMNIIKSGIFDHENCQFDTIFVLAKKNFTINEDFRISGKNLIILAPTWVIVKEQVFDLSGRQGRTNEVGQNGGDFFAFGIRFDKSHLLKVVTNGGAGGRGRNGTRSVQDKDFSEMENGKCVAVKKEEMLKKYGPTFGAPGGLPGIVLVKMTRNSFLNVTVVGKEGREGEGGEIHNITLHCGNQTTQISVQNLTEFHVPSKEIQKMNESSALKLFRKVIRKNSQRLSYEVLNFYKDIWISPTMGQTLVSTLSDFLNSTDYTNDTKEFYEITSQIFHIQMKQSCNMTETQKILLDFALATIQMKTPAEGALQSIIDIDKYLQDIIKEVENNDIGNEYFIRKEAKYKKIIEEANYYLRISLLPTLNETIAEMHTHLNEHMGEYLIQNSEENGGKFQEILVRNNLLRYLKVLFTHVQMTLDDFVTTVPVESDEKVNTERLEKKLYFFRNVRNNITANDMIAMGEFIKLLQKSVEEGEEELFTGSNDCSVCMQEVEQLSKKLKKKITQVTKHARDGCYNIANLLKPRLKAKTRNEIANCEECDDCENCPECSHCRELSSRCSECDNCPQCSGCAKCLNKSKCLNCQVCRDCPTCPQCKSNKREELRNSDSICSLCPTCSGCPESLEKIEDTNSRKTQPYSEPFIQKRTFGNRPDQPKWMRSSLSVPQTSSAERLLRNDQSPSFAKRYNRLKREISTEENMLQDETGNDASSEKCFDSIPVLLREMFQSKGEQCDAEMYSNCSTIREFLHSSENELTVSANTTVIHLKCPECNDTLDFFLEKLHAEISRCEKDSNYNFKELDSFCSPNDGIVFHMTGCDPETFSRTYEEIRQNFFKEFSQFVEADKEHSEELNDVRRNFVYMLTNVDLLLQEEMPLWKVPINGFLQVTDALTKFRDLKQEYEKRITQLHDFSETDMYDLFSSEISMQNERVGMTSKWLSQLRKLTTWIGKVTHFLGSNSMFQKANEKILEAIRLVSEIVHNVKVVEHYTELRAYRSRVTDIEKTSGKTVHELKPVFKKTFVTDVFKKAVKVSQNWMFPLTKSYLQLKTALREAGNATYSEKLKVVAKEVEDHKKSIMLYTTIHSFDSSRNEAPFYKWNVKTRPTLLDDLFSGKPVILVSEILDGGEMNSLMAKDFEMRFVAGRQQKEGTQKEIDQILANTWINITHSGISYFKFGSRIYRRLTETFTFRHTAGGGSGRKKERPSIDYVLSPYTTWVLRLEADESGNYPLAAKEKIGSLELVGSGRYIVNCANIPNVNQHFAPLNDYRRRNEK